MKENINPTNENNTEAVKFVKWITRKGERIYPPKGLKAWPLRIHKKKTD